MRNLCNIFRECSGVSTDSRSVAPGELFFALHGDNFDGNRYAASALERGAAYAVVDSPEAAVSDQYILVDDTLTALQELAAEYRRILGIPILAITGSNGKTTTKELVSRVLANRYRISVTQGNLNNHIGVPLTLLGMSPDTEFGIVEMGANHLGEIASLCRITQPNFGLITNIGLAHLEGFGGADGVRRGKGELFDYLENHGGTAIYRRNDNILSDMIAERPSMKSYGYTADNCDCRQTSDGLHINRGEITIKSHLSGTYNRYNIAAAIGIGEFFGIPADAVAKAVESYVPDNNRSEVRRTEKNTLYLDAYNANPSSMEASLVNFRDNVHGRKVMILGDMLELGDYASAEHIRILQIAENCGAEIYLVGEHFASADKGGKYSHFKNADALAAYFENNPLSEAVVLLKGSRGARLEKIVGNL